MSQLLKFYLLFGYIEEKNVTFEVLYHFYEISHDDRTDIIKTHYFGHFAFFGPIMWFLNKNSFVS